MSEKNIKNKAINKNDNSNKKDKIKKGKLNKEKIKKEKKKNKMISKDKNKKLKKEDNIEEKKKDSLLLFLRDAAIIVVVFVLVIQPLIISSYTIPTASMDPTIPPGTRLIGLPLIYGGFIIGTDIKMFPLKKINRFDIVIFKHPDKSIRTPYVKRVIGLAGDTVYIDGKNVYINGQKIFEPYTQYILDPQYLAHPEEKRPTYGPVKVPEGHLFVMGDNRDNSQDSRYWGFLPVRNVFAMPLIITFSKDPQTKKIRWNQFGKVLFNK
ncbi:MAG: signal peptidase I [Exilispira sp.]